MSSDARPVSAPLTTPDEVAFAVFCIEGVAARLGLAGGEAYRRLAGSGLLNGYIVPCRDALHTQGRAYVVDDLVGLLRERGAA